MYLRNVALRLARMRLWLGVGIAAVAGLAAVVAAALVMPAAAAPATASTAAPAATARLTVSRFGTGLAERRPAKILVANADGSGSRVLTRGWFSYLSPDGSQIAVMDADVNYTNLRLESTRAPAGRRRT